MEKYKLTADSTCDLSDELLREYDIELMCLKVLLGDREHIDRVDITTDDILLHVEETGELPKTAARNQLDYQDMFLRHIKDGKKVIHFSLSSELSSSQSNAVLAAKELNKKETNVYVIDTKSLSLGSGVLTIKAHELLQSGMEIGAVAAEIESLVAKVQASFCVERLDYLHKGGRCSSVELLGANLLNIRPHIAMHDGKLSVHKKYRGNMPRVLKRYVDTLKAEENPSLDICFVAHCNCEAETVADVIEYVKQEFGFERVVEQHVGCTITSH